MKHRPRPKSCCCPELPEKPPCTSPTMKTTRSWMHHSAPMTFLLHKTSSLSDKVQHHPIVAITISMHTERGRNDFKQRMVSYVQKLTAEWNNIHFLQVRKENKVYSCWMFLLLQLLVVIRLSKGLNLPWKGLRNQYSAPTKIACWVWGSHFWTWNTPLQSISAIQESFFPQNIIPTWKFF